MVPNDLITPIINPIEIDLDALLSRWSMTEIRVLLKGHGHLAADAMRTIHKLRGAFGRVLALGASDGALESNRPQCSFSPPCGYHLFHNDLPGPFRDGRLPKPFVFLLDNKDGDLLVTLRLFGLAAHWGAEFQSALVAAARLGFDRRNADPLTFTVLGAERQIIPLPAVPERWGRTEITALTPIVQRRDPARATSQAPPPPSGLALGSLLSGLRFRVEGLALWHGLRPRLDSTSILAEAARLAATANIRQGQASPVNRGGARSELRTHHGWTGQIALLSPEKVIRPLIWLACWTHLGGDTPVGAGRIAMKCQSI